MIHKSIIGRVFIISTAIIINRIRPFRKKSFKFRDMRCISCIHLKLIPLFRKLFQQMNKKGQTKNKRERDSF
jgi:hypothetical protein